tara:strand:- start:307 stop:561 length:255 start_codon:yes stop_codon:yes gene_type:complete
MKRAMADIKQEADEKQRELGRSMSSLRNLEVSLSTAKNRKAYSNVDKIEGEMAQQRSKQRAIEKELDALRKEAFGAWAPTTQND